MTPPRAKKPAGPSVTQLCSAYSRGALRRHELINELRLRELSELERSELWLCRAGELIDEQTYREASKR